jgi:hypothetical protein
MPSTEKESAVVCFAIPSISKHRSSTNAKLIHSDIISQIRFATTVV